MHTSLTDCLKANLNNKYESIQELRSTFRHLKFFRSKYLKISNQSKVTLIKYLAITDKVPSWLFAINLV